MSDDQKAANQEMEQALVEEEVYNPTEIFSPVLTSMNNWLETIHTTSIVNSTQQNDRLKEQTSELTEIRDVLSQILMTIRNISAKMSDSDSNSIFKANDVNDPDTPKSRILPLKRSASGMSENHVHSPKRTNNPCIFCENPNHGPKNCLIRSIRTRKEILKIKNVCHICSTHLPNPRHDMICSMIRCRNLYCRGTDHDAWCCPKDRTLDVWFSSLFF